MNSMPDKIPFIQFPNNPSSSVFINNLQQQLTNIGGQTININSNINQTQNQNSNQGSIFQSYPMTTKTMNNNNV